MGSLADEHASLPHAADQEDNPPAPPAPHDSMVTVRLSGPPALTLDTKLAAYPTAEPETPLIGGELVPLEAPRIGGELIPLGSTPTSAAETSSVFEFPLRRVESFSRPPSERDEDEELDEEDDARSARSARSTGSEERSEEPAGYNWTKHMSIEEPYTPDLATFEEPSRPISYTPHMSIEEPLVFPELAIFSAPSVSNGSNRMSVEEPLDAVTPRVATFEQSPGPLGMIETPLEEPQGAVTPRIASFKDSEPETADQPRLPREIQGGNTARLTSFKEVSVPVDTMKLAVEEPQGLVTPKAASFEEPPESSEDQLQEANDSGEDMAEGHTPSADGKQTPDSEEADQDRLQPEDEHRAMEDGDSDPTAALLAKLEQENNKLETNPKSIMVRDSTVSPPLLSPATMAAPRVPSALRFSMVPPPPMTDLEFYATLVKDYDQTAARMPTLLTNKIHKGIPPPLRGVVWQSICGARDVALEEQYDRLCSEAGPYGPVMGRDLGRIFPGVDMFRDPEGDGQRMLGQVLKCFSLYDQEIGYCQGLAFVVGPLLMHMPDKQAFCVLVRLMERYDLRSSFEPDLLGLHVCIYQFREFLAELQPGLARHLEDLQVDPAYVSQWFLSFFAVTCPLPMLFRIYDILLAEGAAETLMRVALSLMRKNEARLLACSELDSAMQLLLSRGIWDCYHYNADELVDDFVSLSGTVSREKLQRLEQAFTFREVQGLGGASGTGASADLEGGPPQLGALWADVTTVASRFVGRISPSPSLANISPPNNNSINTNAANAHGGAASASASGNTSPKTATATATASTTVTATLSPGLSAPFRPLSMLRRSASKQSLASTLNSMEASSSVVSSTSTNATSISRDSSNADANSPTRSSRPGGGAKFAGGGGAKQSSDDRYLHSQIEDLLTALSELQRSHAQLEGDLQRERRERDGDRAAVLTLIDSVRKHRESGGSGAAAAASIEEPKLGGELSMLRLGGELMTLEGNSSIQDTPNNEKKGDKAGVPSDEDLSRLLDEVEQRFGGGSGGLESSNMSKSQLQEDLDQAKDQLNRATTESQEYSRKLYDLDQEVTALKDQLRESHAHARILHQDKQRLEKAVAGMRTRASAVSEMSNPEPAPAAGGLRELRLGRGMSSSSQGGPSKRASMAYGRDSTIPAVLTASTRPPDNEHEALLLELVQAKTAEALARQEADEANQKLENLRRAYGLAPGEAPPATVAAATAQQAHQAAAAAAQTANAAATAAMGVLGRITTSINDGTAKAAIQQAAANTQSGGFWNWRR